MRPSLALAALLLAALVAGCADGKPSPAQDGAPAADAGEGFVPPGAASDQDRMRFAGTDFSQTQAYDDAWPTPDTCFPQRCAEQEARFDLTAQVPADAPVDLTATIHSDDFFQVDLEVTDGSIIRMTIEDGDVAATLVRKEGGTVTLVVLHASLTSGDPTASEVRVSAEVSTVVRPDVVPAYLPMLVDLVPGDRLLAMGPDVQALVVVPPGLDPVRDLTSFAFNVTAAMPAGAYLVMVKGGEGMLHGPNVTLRPALITWVEGEPRAIPAGQDLQWSVAVPGVPIAAGLSIGTPQGGIASTTPSPAYMGSMSVRVAQRGNDILANEYPCPLPVCSMTVTGLGYSSFSTGTTLFPDGLGRGSLDFTVSATQSSGYSAAEWIGYVDGA